METSISISFLLLLASASFGQDAGIVKQKSIFDDTTLVRTTLLDSFKSNSRIISFNFGKDAIIYLSERNILDTASKGMLSTYDYESTNSKLIIELLKQYKNSDTIFLKDYPQYFIYLVSAQLKKGHAKVLDKRFGLLVPFIYQRLERVISTADRVYYLADHKRFFRAREWSGILPNELMPDYE